MEPIARKSAVVAEARGLAGSDIRRLMRRAVFARFGHEPVAEPIQWLTDNEGISQPRGSLPLESASLARRRPTVVDGNIMERSYLRIFYFSDWRVASLELAEAMLLETGPVDLVVYGGDDVARFASVDFPHRIIAKLEEKCRRYIKSAEFGRLARGLPSDVRSDLAFQATCGMWLGDPLEFSHYAARLLKASPVYQPTSNRGPWTAERVLRLFRAADRDNWFTRLARHAVHGAAAVIGNDCYPEDRYVLAVDRVHDLHRSPLRLNGWGFVGIEGAIVSRGRRPNTLVNNLGNVSCSDASIERHLADSLSRLGTAAEHTVIVSHTPPRGCLDVGLRFGLERLGSPSLAAFIRRHRSPLVLCGHVHSHGGRSDRLDHTVVVNAACDDARPKAVYAAVIDLIPDESPRVTWCDPRRHSVLFVPGIGPTLERRLSRAGIIRPNELLSANEAQLRKAGFGKTRLTRLRAYRTAIARKAHVWLRQRPLTLPAKFLFFDLETGLGLDGELRTPWMIGAMVESAQRVEHWWAPESGQRTMLRQFLEFVGRHPDAVLCSWSGNRFDERAIEAGLDKWYPKGRSQWRKFPKADLLLLLRRNLVLPIDNWKLGPIAAHCGFPQDTAGTLDGFEVGLRYECFRAWGDRLPTGRARRRNANDVLRLARVAQWLREQNRTFTQDQISNPPRETWGRAFARGVIRAYLDGRGDEAWMQACLRRSGVPPCETTLMMRVLKQEASRGSPP